LSSLALTYVFRPIVVLEIFSGGVKVNRSILGHLCDAGFYFILGLEINLLCLRVHAALRPDIVERVGTAQFERNQVIKFACTNLRLRRMRDAVPIVGNTFGFLACGHIAKA